MDPVTRKPWLWQVTALSILLGVLGVLIVTAISSNRRAELESLPTGGYPGLVAAYDDVKQANRALQQEITDLREKNMGLERAQSGSGGAQKALLEELDHARFLAGLIEVKGPGLIITLRDSGKAPENAPAEVVEQYIIHDYDIRNIVNELRAAGAEAISVNDQRVTATTAVRCVGPVMQVNGIEVGLLSGGRTGSKFVIKATGSPEVMESGLRLPNGVLSGFLQVDEKMISIERSKEITVPAYSGSTKFIYTQPVERQQ